MLPTAVAQSNDAQPAERRMRRRSWRAPLTLEEIPWTPEGVDMLLAEMVAAFTEVKASQGSVKQVQAELDLLNIVQVTRDTMLGILANRDESRGKLRSIFDCNRARIALIRAIIEEVAFSEANEGDQRLSSCLAACDTVQNVLKENMLGAEAQAALEKDMAENAKAGAHCLAAKAGLLPSGGSPSPHDKSACPQQEAATPPSPTPGAVQTQSEPFHTEPVGWHALPPIRMPPLPPMPGSMPQPAPAPATPVLLGLPKSATASQSCFKAQPGIPAAGAAAAPPAASTTPVASGGSMSMASPVLVHRAVPAPASGHLQFRSGSLRALHGQAGPLEGALMNRNPSQSVLWMPQPPQQASHCPVSVPGGGPNHGLGPVPGPPALAPGGGPSHGPGPVPGPPALAPAPGGGGSVLVAPGTPVMVQREFGHWEEQQVLRLCTERRWVRHGMLQLP